MAGLWPSDYESRDPIYCFLNEFTKAGHPAKAVKAARAEIDALVDDIYQHRLRLCSRTGLDFEDCDLEGIVSAYDQLNGLVARLMYRQGRLDAKQATQE